MKVKRKQYKCVLISHFCKPMTHIFVLSNVAVTHMNDTAVYFCDFYTPHSYIMDSAQCPVHKIVGWKITVTYSIDI
jgi:hypothetical protein